MTVSYLTPKQVATMIDVSEKTLANWRSQGKGPQYIKRGHIIRYRLQDIESWMEDHLVMTVGFAFEC